MVVIKKQGVIKMIQQLLKDILDYCGYAVDDDGFISIALYKNDKQEPAIIKGKRMVLPTQYHLDNPSSEKIIFYPLKENILHGESDVVAEIREKLIVKLNISISTIMSNLLLIAAGNGNNKLKAHQYELVSLLPEVTLETAKAFSKFFTSYVKSSSNSNFFINIYLKKGGTHKDRKYSCVGIVSFPFYEELIKGTHPSVTKLNKKDKATIIKLAEWLFSEIKNPHEYNHPSVNPNCRHLDALLMTTVNIASRLNDVIADYGDNIFIDDEDGLERKAASFNGDWLDVFNDPELNKKILLIPMQNGNEGSRKVNEPTPEIKPVTPAVAPLAKVNTVSPPPAMPVAPVVNAAPVPEPAPVQSAKKTFDFASANRQPVAQQQPNLTLIGYDLNGQPMYQPAPPQQPVYQQPMPQQVAPGYYQQAQQPPQQYYPQQQPYQGPAQYGQPQYQPQVDAFGRPIYPNNGYPQQQQQHNSRMPNGWPAPPNQQHQPYRRNPY
jgi:hypothetical protein